MRINYLKYWFEKDGSRFRNDATPMLDCFCGIKNKAYRKSFTCSLGHTLLFSRGPGKYLFIVTREDDFIKAVADNAFDVVDLNARLQQGETPGFAACVHMDSDFFGIVTAMHGPRSRRLVDMINEILSSLKIYGVKFCASTFATQVDKDAALKFQFKSTVKIRLKENNDWTRTLLPSKHVPTDVSSYVIQINPVRGKPMTSTCDLLLEHAGDRGVDKMIVRARESLEDELADYYIVGKGAVGGTAEGTNETEIIASIERDVQSNAVLKTELKVYRSDGGYINDQIEDLRGLGLPGAWDRAIHRR